MEVRKLTEEEYGTWDVLVSQSPHGTIFHTSEWLKKCSDLLKERIKFYGCFSKDELVGGCALIIKGGMLKKAVSNFDVDPYGGIILKESQRKDIKNREKFNKNIIDSLCNTFDEEGFRSIEITNSPSLVDIRPFIWNGWLSEVYYTYYLDLKNFENLSKDARWIINKAIANKISVEESTDVEKFYDLLLMTFSRQNKKVPVSKEFLKNLIKMIIEKKIGKMWMAKTQDGEVAAGEIILFDNKRAYRWLAASHTEFRKMGATTLLLYEIFKNISTKFNEIDLMGANAPFLAKFISEFNPKLVPYYRVEKIPQIIGMWKRVYKMIKRFYH